MKKKYIIINVLLSMAVLFSILFQAVHAYGHYSEKVTAKHSHHQHSHHQHSHHQHSKNKTEISDNHSISEKCVTCDFNFSSFTTTDFYVFPFYKNSVVKSFTSFFAAQHSSFFKGSLFALRAPPFFFIINLQYLLNYLR